MIRPLFLKGKPQFENFFHSKPRAKTTQNHYSKPRAKQSTANRVPNKINFLMKAVSRKCSILRHAFCNSHFGSCHFDSLDTCHFDTCHFGRPAILTLPL